MPIEIPKDKWPGSVRQVTLGATAAEGGTRTADGDCGRGDHDAVHAFRRQISQTDRW